MLTNAGGRIRAEKDWQTLFDTAGLTIQTIVTTGQVWDILELVAADRT
jgi:hypothetical protein